ncbi:hypothetical protein J6590_069043 [Homalodisca vitripennis]|nr:hypothetical protein J6590_069043 [Homalodisca vitripennis]
MSAKSKPFRTEVAISRMFRVCRNCLSTNFRDLSVLLGSARLCPHSFSPPRRLRSPQFTLRRAR